MFQTQLMNGTYQQHSVDGTSSLVFTSYNGIFHIEVPYSSLQKGERCIPRITYEFLPEANTCTGYVVYLETCSKLSPKKITVNTFPYYNDDTNRMLCN